MFEQKWQLSGASAPSGPGQGRRRRGAPRRVPAAIGLGQEAGGAAHEAPGPKCDIAAQKSSSLVIARLDRRPCTHCAAWTTRCSLPAVASRTCNARGCSFTEPSVAVLCIVAPSAKHSSACDLAPISLGAKEAGVAVAAARPRILPPLVKRAG